MTQAQTQQQQTAAIVPPPEKVGNAPITPVAPTAANNGLYDVKTTAVPPATTTATPAPTVSYDPRPEALVENRIQNLMDPNSAVNRKAIGVSQQLAAQRGLQSSSIAAEAGTSALIDSARQIASQDATTYAAMQGQNQQYNQNWNLNQSNQLFQSGENTKSREFQQQMQDLQYKQQLGLLDKQQTLQLQQMETQARLTNERDLLQQKFQAGENTKSREFQQQMQDLQYKQQLGVLDKQQTLQLQQMETQARIANDRDALQQKYQKELATINNDQRWKETLFNAAQQQDVIAKQLNQQQQGQYADAQTKIMASVAEAIGQAMSNPNMTAQQQQNVIDQMRDVYKQQQASLTVIFGAQAQNNATGATSAPPATGVAPPQQPIPSPQTGGGYPAGGLYDNVGQPVERPVELPVDRVFER